MLHVICDDYSNSIEVESIANTTTGRVTRPIKTQFTRYSVPDTMVFDGEPHFPHRNLPYSWIPYSRKVWRGESLVNLASRPRFAKLKPSKLVLTINSLLADLLIRQTFFHQMLETSQFAKLPPRQIFPLYSNYSLILLSAFKILPLCVRSDKILTGFTRASTFIADIHTPGPEKAIH